MVIQSRRGIKKSKRGLTLLWMVLIGVVGLIGGAVYYQQEITGLVSQVFSKGEKATEKKKGGRGTIYDRSFKELALSLDRVSVYVRPRELEDIHVSAGRLAEVLGMNEQELLERFDRDVQQVWLAKDISLEEEKAVTELHLPGVFLHREQVRSYPYKHVAAHVIGFADHNMGLAGTEYYYNRLLDQTSIGQNDFPHVDLQGHRRTGGSGQHLVLTIDLKIQDFLEKYVAALGAVHEGAEIAALLMETETGAIVANANLPSFDPNIYFQYKNESLASILLKPIAVPSEIQRFFQDSLLVQAERNCGEQVCPWSISARPADSGGEGRWWEQVGLTVQPDLDFADRNGGSDIGAPVQTGGYPGDAKDGLPLRATPLQILLAFNALVGGGEKVMPHVLDRVLEKNGDREYFFRVPAAKKTDAPLSSSQPAEVWRLLKAQAHEGVLDSLFVDFHGLSFLPVDTRGGEYLRNRMVLAVLPEERPELVLMVLMRQPYLEPSPAAVHKSPGPVVSAEKILPSMVALQQVHKNLSDMMKMAERKEINYQQQRQKKQARLETILKEQHPLMPDLSGLSLRKALRLLQDKNIGVRIQGTGRVVAQSPAAGVPLEGVKECRLTLKKDEKVEPKVPAKAQAVRDRKGQEGNRPEMKK